LTTTRWARSRAACTRLTWPPCKLPIVGTNAMRSPAMRHARTRARNSAARVMMSTSATCPNVTKRRRLETMLRRRINLFLDFPHVRFDGLERTVMPGHEVLGKTRLAPGRDVEHIVENENLAVRVGPGANTNHG